MSSKPVGRDSKHPNKTLIVYGSGYTPPRRQHATAITTRLATMTQPSSSSSGPVTRSSSRTATQRRPPFVSACGGGSTLRRFGSVGSIPAATHTAAPSTASKGRIPFQLPQAHSGFLRRQELHQEKINARRGSYGGCEGELNPESTLNCKCQHPADVSFLQDVYVQNLRTQIEVLELENSYLRGNTSSSATAGATLPPKSILKEEAENGAAFRQRHIDPHPSQQYRSHRVQFTGELSPRGPAEGRSRTTLQLNGEYSNGQSETSNLASRLDEAHRVHLSLEAKLKSQLAENRELLAAKDQLEDRLASTQERIGEERRTLMRDTVEMRRRLDELTPLLAAKEARIAKLENERDANAAQLKKSSLQALSLQAKLEERKREESLVSELDSDRRMELKQLREQIKSLDRQLESRRLGESGLADEIATLRAKLAECEARRKHEKDDEDRRRHELSNDNRQLSLQLKRLEAEMNQYYAERASRRVEVESERVEAEQLRKREKSLERELARCEERLQREHAAVETLTVQLRDRETQARGDRNARLTRIQAELEGLKALSTSLTEENKGLREEKIAFDEKLTQVRRRLTSRDDETRALARDLEEFKRWHHSARVQLREFEVKKEEECDEELGRIVQKCTLMLEPAPSSKPGGDECGGTACRLPTAAVERTPHSSQIEVSSSGWKQSSSHISHITRDDRKEGGAKLACEYSRSSSRLIDESVSSAPSGEIGNGSGAEEDMGELADESELAELRFRKFRRKPRHGG